MGCVDAFQDKIKQGRWEEGKTEGRKGQISNQHRIMVFIGQCPPYEMQAEIFRREVW